MLTAYQRASIQRITEGRVYQDMASRLQRISESLEQLRPSSEIKGVEQSRSARISNRLLIQYAQISTELNSFRGRTAAQISMARSEPEIDQIVSVNGGVPLEGITLPSSPRRGPVSPPRQERKTAAPVIALSGGGKAITGMAVATADDRFAAAERIRELNPQLQSLRNRISDLDEKIQAASPPVRGTLEAQREELSQREELIEHAATSAISLARTPRNLEHVVNRYIPEVPSVYQLMLSLVESGVKDPIPIPPPVPTNGVNSENIPFLEPALEVPIYPPVVNPPTLRPHIDTSKIPLPTFGMKTPSRSVISTPEIVYPPGYAPPIAQHLASLNTVMTTSSGVTKSPVPPRRAQAAA